MSISDYIIEKQLGKGAFGSVSKVRKISDGKIYALKNVKIGKLSQKEKESALNEVRLLYSLNNPNIIFYYDGFYDEPTRSLNIIMEFAEDGDISGKIKELQMKREQFSEETIWNWIIQMLEGIKYLHSNKIIHRDLKCANIFLTKKGIIKIGDLNVSKVSESGFAKTQTGTPYYCAPEIWKDEKYDYKCDIWSIGCIIYELCSLVPPFRGTSLKDLSCNVLKGKYNPIPQNYSKDLSDIISKMLVIDPNKRYSIDQLLNCDIIKKRIKNIKNSIIPFIIHNNKKNIDNVNLIKTIKLPKNLKDINKIIPKRVNKKQIENEMMINDEYEITKTLDFKKVSEELNKNNKYEIPNNNNIVNQDKKNYNNLNIVNQQINQDYQNNNNYKKQSQQRNDRQYDERNKYEKKQPDQRNKYENLSNPNNKNDNIERENVINKEKKYTNIETPNPNYQRNKYDNNQKQNNDNQRNKYDNQQQNNDYYDFAKYKYNNQQQNNDNQRNKYDKQSQNNDYYDFAKYKYNNQQQNNDNQRNKYDKQSQNNDYYDFAKYKYDNQQQNNKIKYDDNLPNPSNKINNNNQQKEYHQNKGLPKRLHHNNKTPNPEADKYLIQSKEEQKRREQQNYILNQQKIPLNFNNLNNNINYYNYKNLKNNNNDKINYNINDINRNIQNRPQSNQNYKIEYQYKNQLNNQMRPPSAKQIYQNHHHHHNYNNNPNIRPPNQQNVKLLIKKPGKVVYEKMNYKDYVARYGNHHIQRSGSKK